MGLAELQWKSQDGESSRAYSLLDFPEMYLATLAAKFIQKSPIVNLPFNGVSEEDRKPEDGLSNACLSADKA
ncbi:hypothetical protein CBR_g11178 [Chara braunii]|uniref:Uncharacterized protein n=1 Tax=Chara braunii TaxID=69332 RepID=A0A388KQG9_CHABU|nr:hypothetical protein CBR_g11178 [Chara braunii]|eukprot:GBG72248.1 hypothetical protein CBR_g11178 [Chara braunii]